MNFDELLHAAWQGARPAIDGQALTRRVRQRQWRMRLQRLAEVALTLAAVVLFGSALLRGELTPAHWLLLPFFSVFLPVIWVIMLRAPGRYSLDATQNISAYARLRLAQLRAGLRDLWLARVTARLLLGYAIAVSTGVWWQAAEAWQNAAWSLLFMAAVWSGATVWLSHALRPRWLHEYRSVRRLAHD